MVSLRGTSFFFSSFFRMLLLLFKYLRGGMLDVCTQVPRKYIVICRVSTFAWEMKLYLLMLYNRVIHLFIYLFIRVVFVTYLTLIEKQKERKKEKRKETI
jgi:hypothetical protein